MIDNFDHFEVKDTASDGTDAMKLLETNQYDVVTLDVEMPKMDGLETLGRIRKTDEDLPVLMVSSLTTENAEVTTRALEQGALDVIPKPSSGPSGSLETIGDELRTKLRAAVRNRSRAKSSTTVRDHKQGIQQGSNPENTGWDIREKFDQISPKVLLIGGSTGAPPVLRSIVERLSGNYPLPVALVQHISEPFLSQLATNYSELTDLTIEQVTSRSPLESGKMYLPQDESHLTIKRNEDELFIKSKEGRPVSGALPSVDVLFSSASRVLGKDCIAVLLSGMGTDGAQGMKKIHDSGGLCLAQDEETSSVYGMPGEARALGGVDLMAPSEKIPEIILDWTNKSLKK